MTDALQELIERHNVPRQVPLERPDRLPLDSIVEVPEVFQPRDGIVEFHVSDLCKALRNLGDLDPVTVMVNGDRYVMVDGHHRREAYRRTAKASEPKGIPVRYFEGGPIEAILEAGMVNSKVTLTMSSRERSDYAWRLVVTGHFSKAEIAKAAVVGTTIVAQMRKVQKTLGEEAEGYATWFRARKAAENRDDKVMTSEDIDAWKQETADRFADMMARTFSTKLARNPEVAAMALATYFGRHLGDVVSELRGHLWADDLEPEDDPF